MAKMFISRNNRLHTVIGLERACDIASTDWKGITGIICQDAMTGNIWTADIQYFNPLKGDKKAWRMVMLMDKYNRNYRVGDKVFQIGDGIYASLANPFTWD